MKTLLFTERAGRTFSGSIHPALKYLPLAFLMSWHYCLWFTPNAFPSANSLLSNIVTQCWLICLGVSGVLLLVIPRLLGRDRYLSRYRSLYYLAPLISIFGGLALSFWTMALSSPISSWIISVLIGASFAVQWLLLGEFYARIRAAFSLNHVCVIVPIVLFAAIGIGSLLPAVAEPVFISLLALLAGFSLVAVRAATKDGSFPVQLPRESTRNARKTVIIVCGISAVAACGCYYMVAIIPWEVLPFREMAFAFGAMASCVLLGSVGLLHRLNRRVTAMRIYPRMLILLIVALLFYVADEVLYLPAFLIGIALALVFELFLVMYLGLLMTKGYINSSFAFGYAGGFIRLGIVLGNGLAVYYESNPERFFPITPETALAFIGVIAVLLIPLLRQEYSITKLTAEPLQENDLDRNCDAVVSEFYLSPREAEVLRMLARGLTAENISEKLVISVHTVNTHIKHIYDKMGIHKRSELVKYLNGNRED